MPKQTPSQARKALARKLEAMATPTNPKVKQADLTLSAAQTRRIIRTLKK
jgi:hypothetical protein